MVSVPESKLGAGSTKSWRPCLPFYFWKLQELQVRLHTHACTHHPEGWEGDLFFYTIFFNSTYHPLMWTLSTFSSTYQINGIMQVTGLKPWQHPGVFISWAVFYFYTLWWCQYYNTSSLMDEALGREPQDTHTFKFTLVCLPIITSFSTLAVKFVILKAISASFCCWGRWRQ